MIQLQSQRNLFDIPDDIVYLNCSYYSPLLIESRDRMIQGVVSKCHPWERKPVDFFDDAETIRNLAADVLGGDPDGFAIVPSASYGISTAARAIEPQLKAGDKILLVEDVFPSNYLPWERTANESGAEIVFVPTPPDGNWTKSILDRLTKRIKVVALPNCHWTNGAYIDLKLIGEACRNINALFVIDITQSIAAMPFSIDEIKPDFMVSSGYKWLLSPYGFNLLYVSKEWRNSRPLDETWIARKNANDFSSLANYSHEYMDGARRFEVGQKCTPTILPGAIAALQQIKKWEVNNISYTLGKINERISNYLKKIGFELLESSYRCPNMFGAIIPDYFNGNLLDELKKKNIYISQRGNCLRFAPHLHINENDLDNLFDGLETILKCNTK